MGWISLSKLLFVGFPKGKLIFGKLILFLIIQLIMPPTTTTSSSCFNLTVVIFMQALTWGSNNSSHSFLRFFEYLHHDICKNTKEGLIQVTLSYVSVRLTFYSAWRPVFKMRSMGLRYIIPYCVASWFKVSNFCRTSRLSRHWAECTILNQKFLSISNCFHWIF